VALVDQHSGYSTESAMTEGGIAEDLNSAIK
jgi:hypothetical protein